MATITTHVLDSVYGCHATDVAVALWKVDSTGKRTVLFNQVTDGGGRLCETVSLGEDDAGMSYELVFELASYFMGQASITSSASLKKENESEKNNGNVHLHQAVIRFSMPNPNGNYHLPIIISPCSYSVWCANDT